MKRERELYGIPHVALQLIVVAFILTLTVLTVLRG